MNKTLAAAAVLALAAFGANAAGTDTPRIDKRQANQEQRIDQGVASGQLNQREARRLERKQSRIDTAENKAKADGTVTAKERRHLHKAQNHASRDIRREKHDRQVAPGK